MADINEQIVKEWLHLCKEQLTIENIKFREHSKLYQKILRKYFLNSYNNN